MAQISIFDETPKKSDRIYRGDAEDYDRASVKLRLYADNEHYKLVAPARMIEILTGLLPDLNKKEKINAIH